MNPAKEISFKNRTCDFFDEIIKVKNFDPTWIKINKNTYKSIFIYYIECITTKNLSNVKIESANPLYFVIDKVN